MDTITTILALYPKYSARKVRRLATQKTTLLYLAKKASEIDQTILKGIVADLEEFHLSEAIATDVPEVMETLTIGEKR